MAKNYFTYDVTHKKSATPKQKIFFECRLEDWRHLFSLGTALYCFRHQSYACTKPHAIRLFWHENPRNQPDVKVLGRLTIE